VFGWFHQGCLEKYCQSCALQLKDPVAPGQKDSFGAPKLLPQLQYRRCFGGGSIAPFCDPCDLLEFVNNDFWICGNEHSSPKKGCPKKSQFLFMISGI
jgi:hypothetical protein